ncbi:MAG TPA: hypothetical protein VK588_01010 [Chitinophagaceae bacterium]|nr:hypothetical protein [Chitinophagaceae bacterium]
MDIYKHKEVLLKWIGSCQTAQQLDLFRTLVTEFEVSRFHDRVEPGEIEAVKKELSDAITEQRVVLAGKRRPMHMTPHFLLIPNEASMCLS